MPKKLTTVESQGEKPVERKLFYNLHGINRVLSGTYVKERHIDPSPTLWSRGGAFFSKHFNNFRRNYQIILLVLGK